MTAVVTSKFDSASAVNINAYLTDVPGTAAWVYSQTDVGVTVGAGTGKATHNSDNVAFLKTNVQAPGTSTVRHKVQGRNTASNGIIFCRVGCGDYEDCVGIQVSTTNVQVLRWGISGGGSAVTLATRSDLSGPIGTTYTAEAIYDQSTNNLKAYFNGSLIFDADAGNLQDGNSSQYRKAGLVLRRSEVDWSAFGNPGDPDAEGGSDTTAPTLTSPVGTQTGSSTATVGATTDEANGTMYAIVSTSSTAPTATQIQAGQTAAGAAAPWSGNQAISTTGAKTFNATGLTASTAYYAHIQHKDAAGNNSSVVTSAQFTTAAGGDTTPPTLSSPTGTATGTTTATGTVSTNESNGTLYYLFSTNSTESAATVKASGGTQAVTATGTQNVSVSGLSPGTVYYAHYLHRDASGNDSTVSNSSSFTTTAAGTLTSGALKRNNGTLAASKTLTYLTLLNDATGAFVATKTGVTTNSSGVFTTSDAGMVAGTIYRAVWKESTGERGHGWVAAT